MKTASSHGNRPRSLPTALTGGSAQRARIFHALSEPTRLDILNCLAACERCVCDLTGVLDAAQSRLSFHLKVLKEAGLIADRRSGRWVYYSIVPEAFAEASGHLAGLHNRSSRGADTASCCS